MTRRVRDGDEEEEETRDERWVDFYDDEARSLMEGWWQGQDDPLYAIYSSGGNYAWVFEDAISNLDMSLESVKRVGRNQYQLGKGVFKKKEIDELRHIRDALSMALAEETGKVLEDRRREGTPRVADFNTFADLVAHAADQLGATHVAIELVGGTGQAGPGTKIFFTRGGQYPYEEARIWRKGGYWHAEGPGARTGITQLPGNAVPIEQWLSARGSRRAAEAPRRRDHRVSDDRVVPVDPREGLYRYRGASIEISGPAGGRWYATIRFKHQEKDVEGHSSREAMQKAKDWIDQAPELREAPSRAPTVKAKVDRRRYDFFRNQGGGGAVGFSAQTAWDLAAAEQEAEDRGWEVTWEDDPEGWDSLGDIDPSEIREVLMAILRDEDGNVLTTLGAIADPDKSYGRVVEAELAFEALDREGWKPSKRRS